MYYRGGAFRRPASAGSTESARQPRCPPCEVGCLLTASRTCLEAVPVRRPVAWISPTAHLLPLRQPDVVRDGSVSALSVRCAARQTSISGKRIPCETGSVDGGRNGNSAHP